MIEVVRFRAPPAAALIAAPLDGLTAIYHRPSGTTHLLAEPAPQILAALADRWLSPHELTATLADAYDLDGSGDALAERLDELVEAGLVEAGLVERA
jgi:PqqD family protein of HPr-rel-A system